MKNWIAFLLAVSCLGPAVAWSQPVESVREIPDSAFLVLAVTKANRAGIAVPDTPSTDHATPGRGRADRVTDRIVHTLVGGFLGTAGGGAAGAAIGAYIDRRHPPDMIPATLGLGILGAIGGLGLGLVVGVLWPVR
jgi:hypothetical protein